MPTSTNPAGCAPLIPTITLAYDGSLYVCVEHTEAGTRVKGNQPSGCIDSGYGARLINDGDSIWACIEGASVAPFDVVAYTYTAAAGRLCNVRGLQAESWTRNTVTFTRCKADVQPGQTNDSVTQGKLDAVNTSVQQVREAVQAGTGSAASGTVQTGDTSAIADAALAQYTPTVLMLAVFTAVLLVRGWDFAKNVVRG